ncbi:hypothetical protein PPL_01191 [Heterostelium album PN500]|uniref:Uncharacterized protein n=1 Tax=Heterostelium pallidum (strain ATCC 26659 / Pp 5 / PN500) TaxID=670386 RepID=D3AYD1_HETP5|nr:hypothetical protein PPL_01191 [Heterostelium album PN500]EFA85958.1 hypothetical protein PPL_01191 [Heterostelium album PN500]|eukprot:XP_020438064.1 hypothetical protein PPL_01191 [Heterostelium album PN500]
MIKWLIVIGKTASEKFLVNVVTQKKIVVICDPKFNVSMLIKWCHNDDSIIKEGLVFLQSQTLGYDS